MTIHPGFLDLFALIAAILIIFGTAAWFLYNFTPNALAWLFPEPLDDDNDEQAEYRAAHVSRLDALDFAARGQWEDHPARRADVARTRRQEAGRRDMERIWRDSMGGPDAA